jgi:hypothetical protein
MRGPTLPCGPLLGFVGFAIVSAGDAGLGAADVVEARLDDMRRDVDSRHAVAQLRRRSCRRHGSMVTSAPRSLRATSSMVSSKSCLRLLHPEIGLRP